MRGPELPSASSTPDRVSGNSNGAVHRYCNVRATAGFRCTRCGYNLAVPQQTGYTACCINRTCAWYLYGRPLPVLHHDPRYGRGH